MSMGTVPHSLTLTTNITKRYPLFVVLNPKEKMGYFKRHWPANLQEDVTKCVEDVVRSGL
jgi:hypothetical protein